jgi:hypothetical protein
MKYNLSNEKYTIILDNAKVHKTIAYMQKYDILILYTCFLIPQSLMGLNVFSVYLKAK